MSPSRAPVFSCAHYFQAPATQAKLTGRFALNPFATSRFAAKY